MIVPTAAQVLLVLIGAAAFLLGAAVFVAPEWAAAFWPWQLTPLTGQVTGAVLSLTGVVNAGLVWDRRWSSFRILFHARLLRLAAIAVSLVLRHEDLRWDRPMTPVFLALVGEAIVVYGAFTVWCEARLRRLHPPPGG